MALGEQTFLVCAGIEPSNTLLDTRAAGKRKERIEDDHLLFTLCH
jgi:hypothetical protein